MVQSLQTTRSATTHKLFSLKAFASCFNSDSATGIASRAWAWNGTDCKLPEEIIITKIQTTKTSFDLPTPALVELNIGGTSANADAGVTRL